MPVLAISARQEQGVELLEEQIKSMFFAGELSFNDEVYITKLMFGVFGSVFNTYNGLYLSKDNDLLLSMPIPVKTIVASRITLVYLMGLLYSASVSLPMSVVYLIFSKLTPIKVVGAVLSVVGISLLVASLSCLLGWIVAKLSTKLKNKGFVKVLLFLVFFAIYYLVFFKGQDLLSAFAANAGKYALTMCCCGISGGSDSFIYRWFNCRWTHLFRDRFVACFVKLFNIIDDSEFV